MYQQFEIYKISIDTPPLPLAYSHRS